MKIIPTFSNMVNLQDIALQELLNQAIDSATLSVRPTNFSVQDHGDYINPSIELKRRQYAMQEQRYYNQMCLLAATVIMLVGLLVFLSL